MTIEISNEIKLMCRGDLERYAAKLEAELRELRKDRYENVSATTKRHNVNKFRKATMEWKK